MTESSGKVIQYLPVCLVASCYVRNDYWMLGDVSYMSALTAELTSSMNMGILRAEDCEDIFWEEKKHWINAPGSGSSLLDIIPLN